MNLSEFEKIIEKANKRELEIKVWNKPTNNFNVRMVFLKKAFKKFEQIAYALGFEIHFIKIKKSKNDGKGY